MTERQHEAIIMKAIREAKDKGVSPYTLIKREIGYGKYEGRKRVLNECCGTCVNEKNVTFGKQKERTQCEFIGITNDRHADVVSDHCCKIFIRRE